MPRIISTMEKHSIVVTPVDILGASYENDGVYVADELCKSCFEHISNDHEGRNGLSLGIRELRMFAPNLVIPVVKEVVDTIFIDFPNLPGDSLSGLDYGAHYPDRMGAFFSEREDVVIIRARFMPTAYCAQTYVSRFDSDTWTDVPAQSCEIGKFYIKRQSLVTSDLPHSAMRTKPLIQTLIKALMNRGYLTTYKKMESDEPLSAKKKFRLMLGADPEFEYMNDRGRICDAFPSTLFDGRDVMSGGSEEIGIDGAGNVIEFRPKAARRPSELRDNVYRLMQRARFHHLSALGNKFPVGCHIHFGVGFPFSPPRDLIMMLDDFLGAPCYSLNGQRRDEYGDLGQVREQPHGFEYRSLPSAVVSDPEFFRIVLKMGRMIVHKYIHLKKMEYEMEYMKFNGRTDNVCMPTWDGYKKICGVTKTEYDYFCKFIETYWDTHTYNRSVVACWNVADAVSYVYNDSLNRRRADDDDDYDGDEDYLDEEVPTRERDEYISILSVPNSSRIALVFRETWHQSVIDDVVTALRNELNANPFDLETLSHNNTAHIGLIGLRANRGNVVHGFNPPVSEGEWACTRVQVEIGNTDLGLCRIFRTGAMRDNDNEYYTCLLGAMVARIRELAIHSLVTIPALSSDDVSNFNSFFDTAAAESASASLARQIDEEIVRTRAARDVGTNVYAPGVGWYVIGEDEAPIPREEQRITPEATDMYRPPIHYNRAYQSLPPRGMSVRFTHNETEGGSE